MYYSKHIQFSDHKVNDILKFAVQSLISIAICSHKNIITWVACYKKTNIDTIASVIQNSINPSEIPQVFNHVRDFCDNVRDILSFVFHNDFIDRLSVTMTASILTTLLKD